MAAVDAGLRVRLTALAALCALACGALCVSFAAPSGAALAVKSRHHKRTRCERTHRAHAKHKKRTCPVPAPGPAAPPPPAAAPAPAHPLASPPAQGGVRRFVAAATPVLSSVKQSHRTWREGGKLAHISSARPPVGSVFSFVLNEHAQVRFTFSQRVNGRRVNGSCVAATGANRSAPACKRSVTRGALSFAGHAGANSVAFQGRLSHAHKLTAGVYELTIVATSVTLKRSAPRSLSFTIVG
jgi:hypothetical protein